MPYVMRLLAIAALSIVAACAPDPVPQDNFYRFGPAPVVAPVATPLRGTLEVDRFRAEGLSAGRAIVYSRADQPLRLNEYSYHFWAEPPAVLLQERLVAFARAIRLADRVVTPEARIDAQFVATGRVNRLEHVHGPNPHVAVSLEMSLRQVGSDRAPLLGTYERVEPAADASVGAAVAAMDRAVQQIFSRFVADMAAR